MRENIGLFKAKVDEYNSVLNLKEDDWVTGYYVKKKVKCTSPHAPIWFDKHFISVAVRNETYEYFEDVSIKPETLCECTGLKDKNGKLIFENDEIYFLDGMSTENGFDDFNNTGFVKWSEEEARFYVTDRESVSSEDAINYCTIIGNKFEEVESEY